MNRLPANPNLWTVMTSIFMTKPTLIPRCAELAGPTTTPAARNFLAPARTYLALLLLTGGLAAGSAGLRGSPAESTIHLTATLTSPIDVKLDWTDTATDAAGYIAEYATDPKGPFIILHFFLPNETTYTHPRLMPETKFYYRVRPIYGPVSNVADFALADDLSDADYLKRYNGIEDYSWSAPKANPEPLYILKKPIRGEANAVAAAPTNFKAVLVPTTVSGIQLSWTNHSSDEEGFLLEKKNKDTSKFEVLAVVPPKMNAFGWGLQPPERKASFRLRAYYYGAASNIVTKTTVQPQNWKNPAPAASPKTAN
jgi:hypothetical protein